MSLSSENGPIVGRSTSQPAEPPVAASHLKNVSPRALLNVSVAIARYRPFSRTEATPTRIDTGTVASVASGTASQNGHPHDATARATTTAPIPAKEYGISEINPE